MISEPQLDFRQPISRGGDGWWSDHRCNSGRAATLDGVVAGQDSHAASNQTQGTQMHDDFSCLLIRRAERVGLPPSAG